jgi:uncharacterized UPF0160 family protein
VKSLKKIRIGFSREFNSTQSELVQHNGKRFIVLDEVPDTEIDVAEVGRMFDIRMLSGEVVRAFEDEISEYREVSEEEDEAIVNKVKVTHENIHDLIGEWHDGDPNDSTPLHEFLGLTLAQYFKFVETDELPLNNHMILATHNGSFHADDVFAYVILKTVFPAHKLIRSRDENELNTADIVFDVGGGKYDHHSVDKTYRDGIPYASFGLIWREFGNQYLESFEALSESERKELFDRLDKEFIQGIDAYDNGVEINTTEPVQIHTVSHLISDFNIHAKDDETEHQAFLLASQMANVILINTLTGYMEAVKEKGTVIEAFQARPQKELLVLPKGCNWKRTLMELDTNEEVKFVVYPDEKEGYRIQVVTVTPASFEARKDLPEEWAGKRADELGNIIGIDDAVFCHPARFLAGAKSEESILEMAKQAIFA